MSAMLSYVHGACDVPLSGETIGQCLDRITAAYPDRDALISRHQQRRFTYAELHAEVELIGRALMALRVQRGDRVGIWSPNCAEWMLVQYATAKIGAILVNVNPAYRTRELEYALTQSGVSVLVSARRFRDTDYVSMLREVRPATSVEQIVLLDDWRATGPDDRSTLDAAAGPDPGHVAHLGSVSRPRARHRRRRTPRTRSAPAIRRSGQHPVHVGNDGRAEGRHAVAPQHPEQRILRRRADAAHAATIASACRCRSTTASAGARQSRVPDPRRARSCCPASRSMPRRVSRGAGGALHGAVRRADDVHRRAAIIRTFARIDLDTLRTGIMAGSPCPIEVMRQVDRPDAPARDDDLLRDDRNLARVVSVDDRRPDRAARIHGGRDPSRTSNARSSIRRPARSSRAASPASSARAATWSCSATGTTRRDARSDRRRRAGCTRAISPSCATTATSTSSGGSRTW